MTAGLEGGVTEAEWLSTADQARMVYLLRGELDRPAMRCDRKERLFSVACCRHMWGLLTSNQRECVVFAERVADGLAPELRPFTLEWYEASKRLYQPDSTRQQQHVANAVAGTLAEGRNTVISTMGWSESVYGRGVNSGLLRDLFGNPYRPVTFAPSWFTSTVTALAAGIYADRAFDRLPILADALEEAGCDDSDVLAHCRGPGPHARGCWVVDGLLGKA